jgi:hypothetical protein
MCHRVTGGILHGQVYWPVLKGIRWFDNDVTLYSLSTAYWPWIGLLIGRKITYNLRECKLADVLHIVVKQA